MLADVNVQHDVVKLLCHVSGGAQVEAETFKLVWDTFENPWNSRSLIFPDFKVFVAYLTKLCAETPDLF